MKKLIACVLFISLSLVGKCDKLPSDAWMWNTLSINKKLTRRVTLGFDEEVRLFDNISRLNLFFTNLGVSYQIHSFKFSLVYRFVNKNQDDNYFSERHRLYFDAAYKYKIKKLSLNYRVRFQGQVRDYYSSENGSSIESYMRHKLDISYNYKKLSPYVAAEFRFQFTNPQYFYGNGLWDRMRYYLGCDYEINKKNEFGVFYMIQHDFNNIRAENDFTIGLQYVINL